ncbi:Fatty acid-binding-like protein 5 [Aphelenchoides besseyi]|nr:Fatty acid-binding-like protein 5 [Aphelenchoides besseyi]
MAAEKFVESENFEAFVKHMGLEALLEKYGGKVEPKVEIKVDGKKWKISVLTAAKEMNVEFELGVEFDEESLDGRKLKSVCTLDNGRLIQVQRAQTAGQKDSKLTRFVDESDRLITEMESDGVTAKRIFKRSN